MSKILSRFAVSIAIVYIVGGFIGGVFMLLPCDSPNTYLVSKQYLPWRTSNPAGAIWSPAKDSSVGYLYSVVITECQLKDLGYNPSNFTPREYFQSLQ